MYMNNETNPSTNAQDVNADEELIAEIEKEMGSGCQCSGCGCGKKEDQ